MDSTIGQVAFDQAQACKQGVAAGAVIVTKMVGHAKGGGTLILFREYSGGCSTVPKFPFLSIYIVSWFIFHVHCCSD